MSVTNRGLCAACGATVSCEMQCACGGSFLFPDLTGFMTEDRGLQNVILEMVSAGKVDVLATFIRKEVANAVLAERAKVVAWVRAGRGYGPLADALEKGMHDPK